MRHTARLSVAAAATLALLGTAPPAWASDDHGETIRVAPGTGTISAAAAAAESGDTLRLKKGVYIDAVNFGSKAISVKGAGRGRTVIQLPATLPPPAPDDFCRDPDGGAAGLCWVAPDGPVRVRDLTTVGHVIGILGFQMHGMRVERTSGHDHDEYGIAAFDSHGLRFYKNVEHGDGGEAGIYIGDTADADAKVAHNRSTGWAFGLFFRDSRHGKAWENTLTKNCIGALVLDTGPNGVQTDPESGETFTNHPAGAWKLEENDVLRNTRFCPPNEEAPPLGGHGIAVVGADHVKIEDNAIKGNNPPVEGESALPSSGVTIVSGALAGGDDPDKVLVEDNRLRNTLDIFWDESGTRIAFDDNRCRTSVPDGLCDD
ncbi:MAG TPA: hypothetical protein VF314_12920 [Actinomycetes bacterium]